MKSIENVDKKESKPSKTDDELLNEIRLEVIGKLEHILHDLKGDPQIEPEQDCDNLSIYMYESSYRRNFEYKKRIHITDISNNKIEYEYNKYFNDSK